MRFERRQFLVFLSFVSALALLAAAATISLAAIRDDAREHLEVSTEPQAEPRIEVAVDPQAPAQPAPGAVAATTETATLAVLLEPTSHSLPVSVPQPDAADDAATTPTSATVLVKQADPIKTVLIANAEIVAEKQLPRPAPGQSLADFLTVQLGPKFHRRASWAGRSNEYLPITSKHRTWGPMGTVRAVTIHHAEGVPLEHPAAMIRNIYRGHTSSNGHLNAADVGYHFFVDRDGHVWEGRSVTRHGTHVGSTPIGLNNTGNIGVCGLGAFQHEAPPAAMVAGAVDLTRLIAQYYEKPIGVRGHEDWVGINKFGLRGGVDCPGRLAVAVRQAREVVAKDYGITVARLQSILEQGERGSRLARAQ